MSDMGDMYRDMREHKKERNQLRMEKGLKTLDSLEIPYRVLSHQSVHYRVDEFFDYWPTTGKFRSPVDKDGQYEYGGTGVDKLVRAFKDRRSQMKGEAYAT